MLLIKIKQLCANANITIAQLERDIGLGKGTIGKWAVNQPSSDSVYKIANYFNVSIDYLLNGLDEPLPIEDERFLTLQRNYKLMSDAQRDNLLTLARIAMGEAFKDGDDDDATI